MEIFETQMNSPLGPLTIRANNTALVEIKFEASNSKDQSKVLDIAIAELNQYFTGELKSFTVPIELEGTDFQVKCWKALKTIPYGETISYKEEALKLGGANYARAVAGANNKNKLPIIIPCHRVIGSDGSLVGYAGGLEAKKKLLTIEKMA